MNQLNFVPAIREVERQIQIIQKEFDDKIRPYEESLKILRELNQACEQCNGKGRILRSRSCAEDDRPNPDDPSDWHTCPVCKGSGQSHGN